MPVLDKDLLKSVVQTLAGIQNVWWSHDPQQNVGDIDRAQVILTYKGVKEVGIDDRVMVTDDPSYPAGTSYDLTTGPREVKIEVKATVFDGGAEALEMIDAIRTGLRRQDVRDLLDGSNMGYAGMTTAFDRHFEAEDREICMAAAEMTLNCLAVERSNFYHPDDTIRATLGPVSITNGGWLSGAIPLTPDLTE